MKIFMRKRKILGIYLIAVIVYGIIVSLFSSTVHVGVDEELYLTLAKSFHFAGKFEINGEIVDYNCVLYSMLISVAYFFYNPKTILFSMRLIGVLTMCSSIFPIWKLSNKVLEDEKKSLKVCLVAMIFPYMFDSAFIMQEVLSYPIFLWTVYFLYCGLDNKEKRTTQVMLTWAALFSALCFFTKTYLFFIPIVVNLIWFSQLLKKKKTKQLMQQILLYDTIYISCVIIWYIGVWIINDCSKGNNHYSTQFSRLFPINGWTMASAVVGIAVYAALLLINTGIFLIPAICFWRKKYIEVNRWLADFTLMSTIVLIFEIVILIVLTEEGVPTVPHKFLFRYFQILVPLLLILLVKIEDKGEFLRYIRTKMLIIGSILVATVYFIYMGGNTRQSIMDGYIYLMLENFTKYFVPYADAFFMLVALIAVIALITVALHKEKGILSIYKKSCIWILVLLWCVNSIQLPLYTNYIVGGKKIQSDSIKIAEYLNENDYQMVYYVMDDEKENNNYIRNFYGYIRQPLVTIDNEEDVSLLLGHRKEKSAVLMRKGYHFEECAMEKPELETEKLDLYLLPEE